MTTKTTYHQSLSLFTSPLTLPYYPTPPVLCASLSGRFFIVGRHEANKEVVITSMDVPGSFAGHQSLPIQFVEGIAQGDNELHILGSRDHSLHDLRLDREGRILEETTLPVGRDLLLTPQIACGQPIHYYFWIDGQGRLNVWQGNQLSTHVLSDITLELTAVITPTGLTLLRAAGIPGYLELLRFEAGRVRQVQTIPGSEQGYCPLIWWQEDHYLLMWVSRLSRSIKLQKVASDFSPQGETQILLALNYPDTINWLRCLSANHDEIILAWQVERPGENLSQQGVPLPDLRQSIALFDQVHQKMKGVTAVNFAAESYFTGCQSGEFLMVVLGGGQAMVLIYQLNE